MRITFRLGGKHTNMQIDIPIELNQFLHRFYDRYFAKSMELRRIRKLRKLQDEFTEELRELARQQMEKNGENKNV